MVFEPSPRHGTRMVSGVAVPRPASTPERTRRFSVSPVSDPPYGTPDDPPYGTSDEPPYGTAAGLPALGGRDDGEQSV